MIHALAVDGGGWLATHPRATRRGTGDRPGPLGRAARRPHPRHHHRPDATRPLDRPPAALEPLSALLTRRHADMTVAARPLTD